MKLIVASLLLNFCLAFTVVPDRGRVRCKCRPSPPGGVTECQSGQTAVCGASSGTCTGSCISLSAQLQPLQYTAALFSKFINEEVTVDDLMKDQKAARDSIKRTLEKSRNGKDFSITLKGKTFSGSVGLSEEATKQLKAASIMMGGKKVFGRGIGIRLP